jgi:hypothetical protein
MRGAVVTRLGAAMVGAVAAVAASAWLGAAGKGIELRVAGRTNATASIASDDDTVAVAWSAALPSGTTDVYAATSRDAGRSFAAPVRVNDVDGDARVGGEQPPRVAIANGVTTVVWTTKGAHGTRLVYARSSDGGATFSRAVDVPGSDAAGNRGWENITIVRPTASAGAAARGHSAPTRRGAAYPMVVWLDHRDLAQQDGAVAASHHDHAAMSTTLDGVAMAQKSKLFVAALDGTAPARAVTGGVCYCCKTAIAAAADGTVYMAWRHVYPGNIRDIAFSYSRDGGRTFAAPVRVSDDHWTLEGCPDDGPALAVDRGGRIHVVWPTLVTEHDAETIALFYATSHDGKRFTPRQRIAALGMPHHPQITIGFDDAPVVTWDESAKGSRRAAMARVVAGSGGRHRLAHEILGEIALYPVVAAVRGGIVAAWTSGKSPDSVIRVERRLFPVAPQPSR